MGYLEVEMGGGVCPPYEYVFDLLSNRPPRKILDIVPMGFGEMPLAMKPPGNHQSNLQMNAENVEIELHSDNPHRKRI